MPGGNIHRAVNYADCRSGPLFITGLRGEQTRLKPVQTSVIYHPGTYWS